MSIYGNNLAEMEKVCDYILLSVNSFREEMKKQYDIDPVDHCISRIKSEESMREKCRKQNIPETTVSALELIHDAIGIRIVCAFISDVYTVRDYLKSVNGIEMVEEKDYIKKVKPNGYRSLHLIFRFKKTFYVEIQIRTISMDTWAALEHQMRYKKRPTKNDRLIAAELKRCADELASTDISMQTIRDHIQAEYEEN